MGVQGYLPLRYFIVVPLLLFLLFLSLGVWAVRSQTYQYAEKLRSQMQSELLGLHHQH